MTDLMATNEGVLLAILAPLVCAAIYFLGWLFIGRHH